MERQAISKGEMMGIVQSYCMATVSSNLKDDAQHHATEKLAAVAMSDAAGAVKIGNLLFRVKYANDHTSYNALKAAWEGVVTSKACLRQWPKDISAKKVARLSLEHWQNDVCTACGGTGCKSMPFTPAVLSDEACPACFGTAKKPLKVKHNLQEYVAAMVEVIENMTRSAAGEAMRKLADDIEL